MYSIKINIDAKGVSPRERSAILDKVTAAVQESITRRYDTEISINVTGTSDNNVAIQPYGVDIVYHCPEVKV